MEYNSNSYLNQFLTKTGKEWLVICISITATLSGISPGPILQSGEKNVMPWSGLAVHIFRNKLRQPS